MTCYAMVCYDMLCYGMLSLPQIVYPVGPSTEAAQCTTTSDVVIQRITETFGHSFQHAPVDLRSDIGPALVALDVAE